MRTTLDALSAAMLLLAAGSLGTTVTLHWAARTKRRLRAARQHRKFFPPISVLKPLCGVDEGLYENLVSFARQRYPEFELVFGIADVNDPAVAVVQRLRADYPEAPVRFVVHGEHDPIANPKVLSLLHAMRLARYEYVLVSDSNVQVEPDYLEGLAAEMSDPNVGLVSNLIVARGGQNIGAKCENPI